MGELNMLSGKSLNKLLEEVDRNRPVAGQGITIKQTRDGVVISGGGGICTNQRIPIPSGPQHTLGEIGPWTVDTSELIGLVFESSSGAGWSIKGAGGFGYTFAFGSVINGILIGMPSSFVYYYPYDWPFEVDIECPL